MEGIEKRIQQMSKYATPILNPAVTTPSTSTEKDRCSISQTSPDYSTEPETEFNHAKSITLPSFWKTDPELWFNTVETIFNLNSIHSNKIKFGKILTVSDCSIVKENSNLFLIQHKNSSDSYELLKSQHIRMYQISDEEKIRKLFSECQLGDRKPNQLYRQMKDLASGQITPNFIFLSWLKKLPNTVEQLIRAFYEKLPEEELITMADGMMKGIANTDVCSIQTGQKKNRLENKIEQLIQKLDESRTRRRSPVFEGEWSRSRSRFRSKFQDSNSNDELCYYHRLFKNSARKCIKPCTFDKISSENLQANR
ncbi:uncharacterized protein [Leptinotarsa decemlineata]|uniref:uncharacterized protein n=1 Tax=Leptinotarsa decemlineata TaxID=7539 RepID=UPI003D306D41